jgi:serine/threonine-protein kinase
MPFDPAHRPPLTSDPSLGSSSANSNAPRAGTYFLGRYRVVDEIGIGGMASVHLARMDGPGGFQKWVAIKRIHPHLVEDETFVHMFLDEARVAARISHPNVAQVFDLGKHEDTYWIAMEYLHGEPLREVMRRTEELGQPMPPEIACRVIADAAEGLHAAHELLGKHGEKLQLVHRDVTPHNLFVTYDGTTKVVDFGIAKFSSRMASTRAGTLKGKLAYMSPEQVGGEPIDRRTDVFALGVVLWELTTGQRLFRMESDLDTLAKVQECNVPRPSTVVRGYPIDLEKIVMKALAKQKNERYKTAREFSRALQSLLMRRGLFIASDEVASYTASIFAERIRKRDEHLRWAAEVTQTINLDNKLEGRSAPQWSSSESSVGSYNSDVKPSAGTMRAVPRPAAGVPAISPPQGSPAISPPYGSAAISQPSVPTKTRPASLTAAAVPDRLRQGQIDTTRPPPRGRVSSIPPDPLQDEGPTLARPAAPSELAAVRGRPAPSTKSKSATPLAGAPLEEGWDEIDDTIVTTTQPSEPPEPPRVAPLPAAGKPAFAPSSAAFASPPRPPRPAAPTPPLMPAVVVPANAVEQGEVDEDETATQVNDSAMLRPLLQRSGSMSGELPAPLAASAASALPVQRLFAAPSRSEQRTITGTASRRHLPMWAIFTLVGVGGALLTGLLVIALVKVFTPTPRASSPAASQSVPTIPVRGPLNAVRAAFSAAIAAPNAPAPPPGAAPPSTATSTADPTPPAPAPPAPTATAKPATKPTAAAPAATGTVFGTLTVTCFPLCDQVLDNGTPLGPSPIYHRKVAVGSRRVQGVWSKPAGRKVVSAIVVADTDTPVAIRQD